MPPAAATTAVAGRRVSLTVGALWPGAWQQHHGNTMAYAYERVRVRTLAY